MLKKGGARKRHSRFLAYYLAGEEIGGNINIYEYDMTGIHIANKANTVVSYIKDEHGNVVGQKSSTENRYQYDAFGNPLKKVVGSGYGNTPNGFGYCGEYYDSESGLIYLRNRYYDSETGRFMTEDPIKDGMNWYVYCGNEPVMHWDPSGLWDPNDEKLPVWANELINGVGGYTEQWNEANKNGDKNAMESAHAGAESVRRRAKAVEIALYYDGKTYYENGFHYYDSSVNSSDGSDCTNFVSVCLNGAGVAMTTDWYWNSYSTDGFRGIFGKSTTDASASWLRPDEFYRYFSQAGNSNGVAFIANGTALTTVPNGVLPGDVIAFNNFNDVPRGYINHVGIVTSIQSDGVHYSGHTISREDVSLNDTQNGFNGDIYIIKINY